MIEAQRMLRRVRYTGGRVCVVQAEVRVLYEQTCVLHRVCHRTRNPQHARPSHTHTHTHKKHTHTHTPTIHTPLTPTHMNDTSPSILAAGTAVDPPPAHASASDTSFRCSARTLCFLSRALSWAKELRGKTLRKIGWKDKSDRRTSRREGRCRRRGRILRVRV